MKKRLIFPLLFFSSIAAAQMPAFPRFQADSVGDANLEQKLNNWPTRIDSITGSRYVTWKPVDLLQGYTAEMSHQDLLAYLLYCYDGITYASSLPPAETRKVIQTIEQESIEKFWHGRGLGHGYAGTLFFNYVKNGYYKACDENTEIWYSAEKMRPFIAQAKRMKQALLDARGPEMTAFFAEFQLFQTNGQASSRSKLYLLRNYSHRGLFNYLLKYVALVNLTKVETPPAWYHSSAPLRESPPAK